MSDLTRREFLERTAVAGAAVTLGDLSPQIGPRSRGSTAPLARGGPGVGRPPDALGAAHPRRERSGKFDPSFWLDYFRRTKADAVCLSAGGCVAYYPTTVPFHHRSQWLGDTRSVR